MFRNYYNIDKYVPDNMSENRTQPTSYTKLCTNYKTKPYEEYNKQGDLIGYSWKQGETVVLDFNIDGEVVVESDAIVYSSVGEEPDLETKGFVNQLCYNVIDMRKWECVSADEENKVFVWEEQEFDHDSANAQKSVYVSAKDYLKGKSIEVTIYNFRFEPILTKTFEGNSQVILTLDKEQSKKLVKGIYYCSLYVVTDLLRTALFEPTDCTLLVK